MKNEVNRALVAKKKLTILFALLTLSVGQVYMPIGEIGGTPGQPIEIN